VTELRLRAAALAPGTIGNIGPGLDVLGMAVSGPGDRVIAERHDEPGIVIADPGHRELPRDARRHTAGIAAAQVLAHAGANDVGIRLTIIKGLPLFGGQGGSAASAVAGAVAANRLIGSPLDALALLACALEAEAVVAGRHADNLAPSLLGGVTLVRSASPLDVIVLPVPAALRVVLAHPDQRMSTAEARGILPSYIDRASVIAQMANVAAMTAAFANGDLELLGRACDDQIAEPARAGLLPGFREAKTAALASGALGGSISGAGPTSFYFVADDLTGERVAAAVVESYARLGIACDARVAKPALRGALALPEDAVDA
jgi:homoserine kinase